jgi:thermitase
VTRLQQFGHVAVRFQDRLSRAGRRRVAKTCGLGPYRERIELPGEKFTLIPLAAEASPLDHVSMLQALRTHPDVVRVARLHRHGNLKYLATERIWISFRGNDRRVLKSLRKSGYRVLETVGEGEYLLRLPPRLSPWVEAARLHKNRSLAWVEPDVLMLGRRFAASAARPQPALRQIGAARAWDMQPGEKSVVVAVLDDGVLASHPDLHGAVVAHYDATQNGNATRPQPWNSHGTECAALVAGLGKGKGGVKGVAFGCGLATIRIGYTPTRLGDYLTKTSWLRRGIDWAWQHGAAVLSMSFGGGPPLKPVTAALERARTLGRNGKGCVLVAAAGNDGTGTVEYPGSARGVMAVAATGPGGKPTSFSNRGSQVAIAAPGVNVYTATIPDPAEQEPGLYTTDSGTSLAAPLVSGAAALLISGNPSLSAAQVRRRLVTTAKRVKGLRFVKARNDRVGAGLLDVAGAVESSR